MSKRSNFIIPILIIGAVVIVAIIVAFLLQENPQAFDGERALSDVIYQVDLGPRTMGSTAHDQAVSYIVDQLKRQKWQVEIQETVVSGKNIKNIIAKRGKSTPWVILASHYDSRQFADQDINPANRELPVPGANDGASSTAILLELGRVIPAELK